MDGTADGVWGVLGLGGFGMIVQLWSEIRSRIEWLDSRSGAVTTVVDEASIALSSSPAMP